MMRILSARGPSKVSAACIAGAFLSACAFSSVAHAAASLTWVGAFPTGGLNTHPHDISGDGSIVIGGGNPDPNSNSSSQAFRWTSATGLVPFGSVDDGHGFYSINRDGSVMAALETIPGGQYQPVRWTQASGFVGLGDVPGGTGHGDATDVNSDGSVIVGEAHIDTERFEAFRWTQAAGLVPLGDLPGGTFNSSATAVSRDGNVVVGYGNSDNGQEAMRWTQSGGMVGLGDLPGGNFTSFATATSGNGAVVVGASDAGTGSIAFHWTQATGMLPLGTLPTDELNPSSYANDVSVDGSVIVGASSSFNGGVDSDPEAFIWTQGTGMVRLWDVLLAHGVNPAAGGWTRLLDVSAISDDGTVVTGYGYRDDGHREAFVAVLPEPATAGALVLSATVVAPGFRRRRRRRII